MRDWNRLFIPLALILIVISLINSCRQSESPISPQSVAENSNPLPPKADLVNIGQVIGQQWVLQAYGRIGSERKDVTSSFS